MTEMRKKSNGQQLLTIDAYCQYYCRLFGGRGQTRKRKEVKRS